MPIASSDLKNIEAQCVRAIRLWWDKPSSDAERAAVELAKANLRLVEQHQEDLWRRKGIRPKPWVRLAHEGGLDFGVMGRGIEVARGQRVKELPPIVLIGRGDVTLSAAWQSQQTGRMVEAGVPQTREAWLQVAREGEDHRKLGEGEGHASGLPLELRHGYAIVRAKLTFPEKSDADEGFDDARMAKPRRVPYCELRLEVK